MSGFGLSSSEPKTVGRSTLCDSSRIIASSRSFRMRFLGSIRSLSKSPIFVVTGGQPEFPVMRRRIDSGKDRDPLTIVKAVLGSSYFPLEGLGGGPAPRRAPSASRRVSKMRVGPGRFCRFKLRLTFLGSGREERRPLLFDFRAATFGALNLVFVVFGKTQDCGEFLAAR